MGQFLSPRNALVSRTSDYFDGLVCGIALVSINEVNLHRARLTLGWLTCPGLVPGAGHLSLSILSRLTSWICEGNSGIGEAHIEEGGKGSEEMGREENEIRKGKGTRYQHFFVHTSSSSWLVGWLVGSFDP